MTQKSWSEMEEVSSVSGIKFLFAVYRTLGRKVFTLFLTPVILYYFLLQGSSRRASLQYLARIKKFNALPSRGSLLYWCFRHFMQFGTSLLDKLSVWSGRLELRAVDYEGRKEFLEVVDRGRGAIIIVSHVGNVEACRVVAGKHQRVTLNILVHTKHAEKFNQLIKEQDANSALNLIQVTEISPATAVMLSEKLAKGEVVAIAGDRTPVHGHGRQATARFLGEDASFPQGPYILASILKCPVFFLLCIRQKAGFKVIVEKMADRIQLPRGRREQEIDLWAQRYADRLQHHVLKYPLQWFNFYDFWRINK